MNLLILSMTLLLLGKNLRIIRITVASIVGGIISVVVLLSGIKYGAVYIFLILLTDVLMLQICMLNNLRLYQNKLNSNIEELLIGIVYFHGIAFAYTKMNVCVLKLGVPDIMKNTILFILIGVILMMSKYQSKRKMQRLYSVCICKNGEVVEVTALYDTGNSLKDPVSGKSVSVIEKNERIKSWIETFPQHYKIVPFKSIGNENGVLEGTIVDELIIKERDKEIIQKNAIIALYDGILSSNGSFQMILNQSLLKRW